MRIFKISQHDGPGVPNYSVGYAGVVSLTDHSVGTTNQDDSRRLPCHVIKSTADRIIDHLGPLLALQLRRRFATDTALILDGTLVSTRDHQAAEQSENYRYSTNHQAVIDADTRLVVAIGRHLPGNRNDC